MPDEIPKISRFAAVVGLFALLFMFTAPCSSRATAGTGESAVPGTFVAGQAAKDTAAIMPAAGEQAAKEPAVADRDMDGPVQIDSVAYEIVGVTRKSALAARAGIVPGMSFPDRAALDAFLADRRQALLNERVLASVEILVTRFPSPAADGVAKVGVAKDGVSEVGVVVRTVDTWNLIALPYLKYDSNVGLTLSARLRHYNFLGSMRTFSSDLDYRSDTGGVSSFSASADFSLPFRLFGRSWLWTAGEEFILWPDQEHPVSRTTSTLSVDLPSGRYPLSLAYTQTLRFHDEKDADPDSHYLGTGLSLEASIPSDVLHGGAGPLVWKPGLAVQGNWKFGGAVRADRRGPVVSLVQGFEAGRVDWRGNMRSGDAGNVSGVLALNAYSGEVAGTLDGKLVLYRIPVPGLGIAARLSGFATNGRAPREDIGSAMRGVLDARMRGFAALFLNLNIPLRIGFVPVSALIGKRWFDFELQISPFMDFALVDGTIDGSAILRPWYSGGLEVYVFPEIMRSFIVRASAGFDLVRPTPGGGGSAPAFPGPYELYFGVGLMF